MATLKLYQGFKKRINSTKQPANTVPHTDVTIDVLTVENLKTPRFRLSGSYLASGYNYAYFEGRYYFLDEPTIINGDMIEIRGNLDVLATYKQSISNTNAFIRYTSLYDDEYIVDDRISTSKTINIEPSTYEEGSTPDSFDETIAYCTIAVVGDNPSATVGGVNMFLIDGGEVEQIIKYLLNDGYGDGVWTEVEKYMNDAFSCLLSAKLIPFKVTNNMPQRSASPGIGTVYLGKLPVMESTRTQYINGIPLLPYTFEVSLPQTPAKYIRYWRINIPRANGDFRDYAPYSKYFIWLPYRGYEELDPQCYRYDSMISVEAFCDPIGGTITYSLRGNYSHYTEFYTVDVGVDVPLSAIKTSMAKGAYEMGTGAITGVLGAGMALGGNVAVGGGMVVGGITGFFKGMIDYYSKTVSAKGGVGDFGKFNMGLGSRATQYPADYKMVHIEQYYFETSDDPKREGYILYNGRPYYKTKLISTLVQGATAPVYIQCEHASCNAAASEDDLTEINSYLNGGFFYE